MAPTSPLKTPPRDQMQSPPLRNDYPAGVTGNNSVERVKDSSKTIIFALSVIIIALCAALAFEHNAYEQVKRHDDTTSADDLNGQSPANTTAPAPAAATTAPTTAAPETSGGAANPAASANAPAASPTTAPANANPAAASTPSAPTGTSPSAPTTTPAANAPAPANAPAQPAPASQNTGSSSDTQR